MEVRLNKMAVEKSVLLLALYYAEPHVHANGQTCVWGQQLSCFTMAAAYIYHPLFFQFNFWQVEFGKKLLFIGFFIQVPYLEIIAGIEQVPFETETFFDILFLFWADKMAGPNSFKSFCFLSENSSRCCRRNVSLSIKLSCKRQGTPFITGKPFRNRRKVYRFQQQ